MRGIRSARAAIAIIALTAVGTAGCTDSQRASIGALGSKHTIILYSGGREVRRWISTGKVTTGEYGSRFAFRDAATGKYVRVTGTVAVIEGEEQATPGSP